MDKKIFLYFFSGTGNTLWVSRQFAGEMAKHKFETELLPLPAPAPVDLPEAAILAIAFPVYAQTAPPFICEWMRNLPETRKNTPVILISTLAGFSGLVKGPFRHMLEKKGYRPLAVSEFIMPPNYFHKYDEPKNEAIRESAKIAIADFAKAIAEGRATWPSRPSILDPMQFLAEKMFKHGGSSWLGRGFKADGKCTRCGLCMKLCPVKSIVPDAEGRPSWNGGCEQCLRCITYCPAGAISSRRMKLVAYPGYRCQGINPKDFLPTSERPVSPPAG